MRAVSDIASQLEQPGPGGGVSQRKGKRYQDMSYEERLDYRAALKARELGFYDEVPELEGETPSSRTGPTPHSTRNSCLVQDTPQTTSCQPEFLPSGLGAGKGRLCLSF